MYALDIDSTNHNILLHVKKIKCKCCVKQNREHKDILYLYSSKIKLVCQ